METLNWTTCAAIETIPGKLSGQPVIRGTRMRPQDLQVIREEGVSWLSENFSIPQDTIRQVFDFYDERACALHPA